MNPFQTKPPTIAGPFRDIVPITPSDTTVFSDVLCGLLITGNGGNVAIVTEAGNTRTVPVVASQILPVGVQKVLATGTTATGIMGFSLS